MDMNTNISYRKVNVSDIIVIPVAMEAFPLVAVGCSYTFLLTLCNSGTFLAEFLKTNPTRLAFRSVFLSWKSEFLTCHEHSVRHLFLMRLYSFI